jgi:signal transduction histidine kinase
MFSTKKQRFGMGLSIVNQIVSEHMGEIDVESDTGKGTTFRIKLPVRWIENNT